MSLYFSFWVEIMETGVSGVEWSEVDVEVDVGFGVWSSLALEVSFLGKGHFCESETDRKADRT